MSSVPKDSGIPDRLSFLNQVSPDYIEALESLYQNDPRSVPSDWAYFFDVLHLGQDANATASENFQVADELQVFNLITAYRARGHLLAQVDPLGLYVAPVRPYLDLNHFKLDHVEPARLFQ